MKSTFWKTFWGWFGFGSLTGVILMLLVGQYVADTQRHNASVHIGEIKMTDQLRNDIRAMAGTDGWWKCSSRQRFETTAEVLLAHGFTEDEVLDLLRKLYRAVAECYGD